MMEQIFVDVIVKMIGNGYNKSLMVTLVNSLFPTHKYVPFRKMEDLEGMIYVTCDDMDWDVFHALAIHSGVNLVDGSGNNFGSCLIIPNVTRARFVDTMQRAIKIKAFL